MIEVKVKVDECTESSQIKQVYIVDENGNGFAVSSVKLLGIGNLLDKMITGQTPRRPPYETMVFTVENEEIKDFRDIYEFTERHYTYEEAIKYNQEKVDEISAKFPFLSHRYL